MRARLNMLIAGQVLPERTLQMANWFNTGPKRGACCCGVGPQAHTTSR
jgi:hypothetical protein